MDILSINVGEKSSQKASIGNFAISKQKSEKNGNTILTPLGPKVILVYHYLSILVPHDQNKKMLPYFLFKFLFLTGPFRYKSHTMNQKSVLQNIKKCRSYG